MQTLGVIGIFVALALFIYLTVWAKWHIFFASSAAALLVIIFNGLPIWDTYFSTYFPAAAGYFNNFSLILILGAFLGQCMEHSGAAKSIAVWVVEKMGAKNGALAIFIISAVLTYGGVNVLVVVFTVYPIGIEICRRANMARQVMLAAFIAGSCTFTMTSIPGTPSSQNLVPTTYLGTNIFAGPVIGLAATAFLIVAEILFLRFRENQYKRKGIFFEPGPMEIQRGIGKEESDALNNEGAPSFILSIIPLCIVLVGVMALTKFTTLTSTAVVAYANILGIAYCLILFGKKIFAKKSLSVMMKDATVDGILSVMGAGLVQGFGSVVAVTAGYQYFVDVICSMNFNPIISASLATQILCGITGSSITGLRIFCSTMSERFVAMGVNVDVLHRLSVIACGGFDSVPHGGPLIVLQSGMGFDHRTGYPEIFWTALVIPVLANIVGIIVAMLGFV